LERVYASKSRSVHVASSKSKKGFLAERRIINYEEALCPFCCKEIETIHHLFHLYPTS